MKELFFFNGRIFFEENSAHILMAPNKKRDGKASKPIS